MTKFFKRRPADYSVDILKHYPEHVKIKMVDRALIDKDYDSLSALFSVMQNPYIIISKAFNVVDVEAIKLVISKTKLKSDETQELAEYFDIQHLIQQSPRSDLLEYMDSAKENAKQSEIIKLLLEFQDPNTINSATLETLSQYLTRKEFNNFIKSKNIDLSAAQFEGLNLAIYELEILEPILFQKNSLTDYILKRPNPSLLDLLLSRSYSDELSVKEISTIYYNLYKSSPISKEMITLYCCLNF